MTQPLEITLKTLTPLWTGGAYGKMDRIHETGIIGSLRWWYEAIVRGLGGQACDPSQGTCQFDAEKYAKSRASDEHQRLRDAGLCDVCQVFGATGWRRRFRLKVDDSKLSETWSGKAINVRPPDRNRGWYLNPGKVGNFTLRIMADEALRAQVLALIQFMARYGNLGARPQLGYGQVEIVDVKNKPKQPHRWPIIGNGQLDHALPDLRTFTFFTLNFEPQIDEWWRNVPGVGALTRDNRYRNVLDSLVRHRMMPTTPALKNVLRYGRQWSTGALPHQFFGTLRGNERRRSKIALSWAFRRDNSSTWEIRGWAYPPQRHSAQREEIRQRLQEILGTPEACLRALNIRYHSAEISFAPTTTFFDPLTSNQIQKFVQESTEEVLL